MTIDDIPEVIATQIMEWHKSPWGWWWLDSQGKRIKPVSSWFPTSGTHACGLIRKKLSEKYDWLLGCGGVPGEKPFGFALFEKGAVKQEGDMKELFIAEAETEHMAICLCALKSKGIEFDGDL